MRILVTGAAGFIGSHLAERLAALKHRVFAVDCLTDYYSRDLKMLNVAQIQGHGVEFFPLDLAKDNLAAATRDIDFIFHLAAQPGISATTAFETYMQNNIIGTSRLLESVKQSSNLRGFINISTSSVYGTNAMGDETTEPRPISGYGVTKLAAEQLVLSYTRDQGFPACSLRLFSVYGPRERPEKLYPQLISCILENRELSLYEGSWSHLRSYTYVDDIVDGLIATLENFDRCIGEIFNIGTSMSITTAEGIKIVEGILGKPVKIALKPRRSGDQVRTQANIEKARRVLGYNPVTPPLEGLAREIEWYLQNIFGKLNIFPSRNRNN